PPPPFSRTAASCRAAWGSEVLQREAESRAANSVFTLPLVGRVASEASRVGVGVSGRTSRQNNDPHPQPLPSRLRACPLPTKLKATKPRQAGVWLGRGADRVRGVIIHQEQMKLPYRQRI